MATADSAIPEQTVHGSRSLELITACLMLLYPGPVAVLGLLAAFISFAILDDTP